MGEKHEIEFDVTLEETTCEARGNGGIVYYEPKLSINIDRPRGSVGTTEEDFDFVDRDMVATTAVFTALGYESRDIALAELRAALFAILKPEVYAVIAKRFDDDEIEQVKGVVIVHGAPTKATAQ